MAAERDIPTHAEHPFRAAWRTRDLEAWAENMAEGIVLYSPIIKATFDGRAAAIELFAVLFDVLDSFEITDEFAADDAHVFFWRASARGRSFEGADLLRHDSDGKIYEVRVQVRTLIGIGHFGAALGPALARRHGPIRGALLRVSSPLLSAVFAMVDATATRLTQDR